MSVTAGHCTAGQYSAADWPHGLGPARSSPVNNINYSPTNWECVASARNKCINRILMTNWTCQEFWNWKFFWTTLIHSRHVFSGYKRHRYWLSLKLLTRSDCLNDKKNHSIKLYKYNMLTEQMFNVKQLCFQAEFVQNRLHTWLHYTHAGCQF